MTSKSVLLALLAASMLAQTACAPQENNDNNSNAVVATKGTDNTTYLMEDAEVSEDEAAQDFNSFDKNIEEKMLALDEMYKDESVPSDLQSIASNNCSLANRLGCSIYVKVVKDRQELYLYINGKYTATWAVSTGRDGFRTPNMDTKPVPGRIYTRYESNTYPGGDYQGLGNMPYAVFIQGGFALHGTGAIAYLGQPASHGCIRMHPDNAKYLNSLIRQAGVSDTWVTVTDTLGAGVQPPQHEKPKKKFNLFFWRK